MNLSPICCVAYANWWITHVSSLPLHIRSILMTRPVFRPDFEQHIVVSSYQSTAGIPKLNTEWLEAHEGALPFHCPLLFIVSSLLSALYLSIASWHTDWFILTDFVPRSMSLLPFCILPLSLHSSHSTVKVHGVVYSQALPPSQFVYSPPHLPPSSAM